MAVTRYATRAVEIDGVEFNNGDIIPMNIYIEDDSSFVRYEGGTKETKAEAKAADKSRRAASLDAGITSESFAGSEKVTTKAADAEDVKTLFAEDGEEVEGEKSEGGDTKAEGEEEKPAVVAEDAKTEEALKKDDKKDGKK